MLFEKEKYYKYIKTLETFVNFYYVIFIILFAILGIAIAKGLGLILGGIIGFLFARMYTLKTKISIQKMKLQIDIHEEITKK